jgi:hypothetical protein
MSIDFDLAALPEGMTELGLSDPDSYQDELPPAPPQSGNYRFRVADAQLLTNADGRPLLADDKFPQIKVNAVQIVEPPELADRMVYIWQTFSYKPYSNRPTSNKIADLIRAHDRSLTWSDSTDGIRRLLEVIESGQTFCAKLDWVAKDTQWYREERERTGGDYKSVPFNAWILRGQNSFPKDDKGNAIPLWEGPSGDKIEARAELKSLFSSDKDTKLVQL